MPLHTSDLIVASDVPAETRAGFTLCRGSLRRYGRPYSVVKKTPRRKLADRDRDDLRDARLLHGDAVQHAGALHGALVVGDEDELRAFAHLADHLTEAADVGVVERRIDLVEDAERCRVDEEEREDETDGNQGLLAARQQADGVE